MATTRVDPLTTITLTLDFPDVVVTRVYPMCTDAVFEQEWSTEINTDVDIHFNFVSHDGEGTPFTETRVYKEKICRNCGRLIERRNQNRPVFDVARDWQHKETGDRECSGVYATPEE